MITTVNSQNKSKAFTIRSVMGNPKLARLITSANSSPVGSTKRRQAKGILMSLSRARSNFDGQGGPILDTLQKGKENISPWTPTQNQLPVSGTTAPQTTPPQPITPVVPPAVAPPPQNTQFVKSVDHIVAQKPTVATSSAIQYSDLIDVNGTIYNKSGKGYSDPAQLAADLGIRPDQIDWQNPAITKSSTPPTPSASSTTSQYGVYDTPSGPMSGLIPQGASAYSPDGTTPPTPSTAQSMTGLTPGPYVPPPTDTGINYSPYVQDGQLYTPPGYVAPTDVEQYLAGYPETLQKAFAAGIGSKAFAMDVMGDKKKMAEVLGIPEESLDLLPDSPFLSVQLNDLKSSLKKEYGLDNKLQKLEDLQSQGVTIESDLTAYIREKDKYYNQLDTMYDKAEKMIANTDTSNPYVAQRYNNYLNYLTVLKGRQNQRYIDFLKSGIDYHNADLKRAEDSYNTSVKAVDAIFATQKDITTEQFKDIEAILKDMYDNVTKRDDLQTMIDKNRIYMANAARDEMTDLMNNVVKAARMNDNIALARAIKELHPDWTDEQIAAYSEEVKLSPAVKSSTIDSLEDNIEKFMSRFPVASSTPNP